MTPPDTTYRGGWGFNRHGFFGPLVTRNGAPFEPPARSPHAVNFAWGYSGAGPQALAFALILDATGDRHLAERAYRWFCAAEVINWGTTWSITAHRVRVWLDQFERENRRTAGPDEPDPVFALAKGSAA